MTIKEYLNRPYHIVLQHISDETGSYFLASVTEFDGCVCQGQTYVEAYEKIRDTMEKWIEAKLASGLPVPEPVDERQFSGKFSLRVPRSLHARLALDAIREGVSLNQYVLFRLSNMDAG